MRAKGHMVGEEGGRRKEDKFCQTVRQTDQTHRSDQRDKRDSRDATS